MQKFEHDYSTLVDTILNEGVNKITRNGITRSLFGKSLIIDNLEINFPIIQGRKIFTKGVIGEFCALIRQPKCLNDFKKWGCNYWDLWATEKGELNVDYGNEWFANGQIDYLKDCLKNNPDDRRMIVSGWNPAHVQSGKLSLPCCHYSYQFYVSNGTISMIWTQRSVDMMIGLPADIILAALWLITLANEFGYQVGSIKMDLGDCHIYDEHIHDAKVYVERVKYAHELPAFTYKLNMQNRIAFETFTPDNLVLSIEPSLPKINFKLKA
tara:strand:- start:1900 stop:2703 length:804 start_codon:yes stop_codon:yes gene_type:complete